MTTMEYKGFRAIIEYDYREQLYIGHVENVPAIIEFEGFTIRQAENDFYSAVDAYLEDCALLELDPFTGKSIIWNVAP